MAEGKPCIVMPDSAAKGAGGAATILGRVWLAAGLAGLGTTLAISVKDVGAEGESVISRGQRSAQVTG